MTRIKICGLTRPQDVDRAVELGADCIGFVLAESSRQVDLPTLAALTRRIPPPIARIAVMVDPSPAEVQKALQLVDWVQLHGGESPEFCGRFPGRLLKAFRVRQPEDLEVDHYAEVVSAYLFDAYHPRLAGGTGERFNWEWLQGRKFARRFFLSGGLTPANVGQAIEEVCPWGVDVSSGVESDRGIKDPGFMADFIRQARLAAGFSPRT
ncbi:MAG: phosphoribosylanthranilate isomerase [Candidatus Eremiobacteraeota bacterium]|nr:phosphoribosylanthranilate isomerase [Candidatus Eremiobacteraeota bacterium]